MKGIIKKLTSFPKKYYIFTAIILLTICTTYFYFFQKNEVHKPITNMNYQQQSTKAPNLLSGQWDYIPGVKKENDYLKIYPVDLTIAQQNGKTFFKNPPVNVYGTYLENLPEIFNLSFSFSPQQSSIQFINLYEKTPLIADEFKVDQKQLNISVYDKQIIVNKIEANKKTETSTFLFKRQNENNLVISKDKNNIVFKMNNDDIGTIKTSNIFSTGKLYFGFSTNDGEWLLTDLNAKSLNNQEIKIVDNSQIKNTSTDEGLQSEANKKRSNFTVGSSVALYPLTTDLEYQNIATNNKIFGSISPENQMKMINLQPQKGIYTFEFADALVDIAEKNNQKIHGHTLVFGEANPKWVNDLPVKTDEEKLEIKRIMNDHITTVIKHFGNKISSWDVINEPLADYDQFENGQLLRNHKWHQAMGEDYIFEALKTAYQTNPELLYFINEYGLETDGERWDAFIALLTRLQPKLKSANIPVTSIGIGFQSHIYESEDRINPNTLRAHIKQLEQLGFKSQVSELDVYSDDGDLIQSNQYKDVFLACLNEPNCIAYRVWILSDKYDLFIDDDNSIQYGQDGLFDPSLKPRPAYNSILKEIKKY